MKQPEFIFYMHNAKIDDVDQGDLCTIATLTPNILIKHYHNRNNKITINFPEFNKEYVIPHKHQLDNVISLFQQGLNVETRISNYCSENFKED